MTSKKTIKQKGANSIAAIDSKIFIVNSSSENNMADLKRIVNNEQTQKSKNFFESAFNKFAKIFKSQPTISFESYNNIKPNLTVMLAPRKDAVNSLLIKLEENTILNLFGGAWTGKTHLIYLIGKAYSTQKNSELLWFECGKNLNDHILENLLNEMKLRFNINEIHQLDTALRILPKNSVFIFDDFPFNKMTDDIKDFIIAFQKICERYSFKIITSSATDINFRVKSLLKSNTFYSCSIPPFNEKDVYSILDKYSNLDTKSKAHVSKLISGFASQNPAICSAHIQYLKQHNWIIDDFATSLIQKGFTIEDLENFVQDTLTSTLTDQETRELLYRISLVSFKFNFDLVKKLSNIEPEISLYNEKFRTLDGYWIEPIENLYKCNPLIKNLGEKNIKSQTLIKVHSTLADAIIQEKTLTPNEFINAFTHLIKCNNYNKAAFLLTHILKSLFESDVQKDYWSLTDIWIETGLPKELDDDIAYLLKAQQIITRAKLNKPIEKLLREFQLLVKNRGKHANEIVFYLVFYLSNYNIDATLDLLLEYNLFENAPTELLDDSSWEVFIWIIASKVKGNGPILRKFIDVLHLISIEQFQNSLQDDIGYSSIQYLTTQTYINLKKEPIDLIEVNNTLKTLDKLEQISDKFKSDYFKVDILTTKLIIFNEYQKDFEKALAIYLDIKSIAKSTENIFLLNYRMGKTLYFSGEKLESKSYLELASKNLTNHYEYETIDTLMLLATIESENTLDLLKLAEDKAERSEFQLPMLLTRLYAELGTYYFLNNDYINCYKYYKKAWYYKKSDDINSSNYKIAITLLGHCSGYVSSIINTGSPPADLEDGVYTKPFIGSNWIYNEKVADYYKSEHHEQGIILHLAKIAECLEFYDDAKSWYKEICDSKNTNPIYMLSAYSIAPYLINSENYSAVLLNCISATKILYSSYQIKSQRGIDSDLFDSIEIDLDLIAENYHREFYERILTTALIPIVLKVFSNNQLNNIEKFNMILNLIKTIDTDNAKLNSHFEKLKEFISSIKNNEFSLTHNNPSLINKSSNEKTLFYILNAEFVDIRETIIYHAQIIGFLYENYSGSTFSINKIVDNYFMNFWINKFMKNWSEFENPYLLQTVLQGFSKGTISAPAKRIIITLSDMYHLRLPEEISTFLNDEN